MRIIVYTDGSIISDELAIDLIPGNNIVTFDIPGYLPNSLYILTEYPYSYDEANGSITLTIDIPLDNEDNILIPVIYTTNMITGGIHYEYDINTGEFDAYMTIQNNLHEYKDVYIGVGIISTLADLTDNVLEYSLLGKYTLNGYGETILSIPVASDENPHGIYPYLYSMVDLSTNDAYLTLKIERFNGTMIRPPYPGLLYIEDSLPEMIDSTHSIVHLGEDPNVEVSSINNGINIVNKHNMPIYLEIDIDESIPVTIVSTYENEIIPIRDSNTIAFQMNKAGNYTIVQS